MNPVESIQLRPPSVKTGPLSLGLPLTQRLPPEVQLRNPDGPIDAQAILSEHPDLSENKSIVLDLAYEEYFQRQQAGQSFNLDEFCQRFPAYQSSLRQLLHAHQVVEDNAHLLPQLQSATWPQPGEVILGFRLLEELGRGAFARVFLAAEPALGNRLVAVKVSLQKTTEAEIHGRLSHPNIVPIHSVHTDPFSGLTMVCMPYLGKATLCDVLNQVFARPSVPSRAQVILTAVQDNTPGGRLLAEQYSPDRWLLKGSYLDGVVHLAIQLTDALAYVHAQGIYHLDLKPSNVLMSPAGQPMLLDFNLSFDHQRAGQGFGGTPPYMSPEQLLAISPKRAGRLIDARSDLFSLGVILYELLTGTYPFGSLPMKLPVDPLRSLLLERQRVGPPPIQQVNPRVDPQLARLVQRCLAYDPQDRPQSAVELATLLRNNLSRSGRMRRWAASHTWTVLAAFLLTVASTLGAAYGLSTRDPYSVRQYQQGQAAYQQGDYPQAVERFTSALKADPNLGQAAHFARGRAYLQLGNGQLALANFEQREAADRLRQQAQENHQLALADFDGQVNDGRMLACRAYCLNQLKQHRPAATLYHEAIAKGFASAEVYNDLGFTWWQLGEYQKAETELTKAIQQDDRLQVAYYNRALIDLQRALQKQNQAYVPKGGIQDIEKAIALGPATADLYRHAAGLYALARETGPALRYLTKALELGQDPKALERDPVFEDLKTNPDFNKLLEHPRPLQPPPKAVRLVDPIKDSSS